MGAITVGRVCIKTAGRDAGEKCVITKIIDKNFVEIRSIARKKIRKCAIRHLEPTDAIVSSDQFGG
jgi:large subunit ribosomal protein L14e